MIGVGHPRTAGARARHVDLISAKQRALPHNLHCNHSSLHCNRTAYSVVARRLRHIRAASTQVQETLVVDHTETEEREYPWLDQWYPVYYVKDLDTKAPNRFTLLNFPLVIWMNNDKWSVFIDACPHRLVPLSEGRITAEGELECPYHGWRFDATGTCTAIPQGGDCKDPRTAATALPCVVRQGMLWVKPVPLHMLTEDDEELTNPVLPLQPEIDDPSWTAPLDMFRDFPLDYATVLENVVDVGHVSFTHHNTVSNRETSGVFDLRVTSTGEAGFTGSWPTGPRNGKWGPQSTQYQAPCYLRHTFASIARGGGVDNITSIYVTPIAPGRCRAFVRNQLRFSSPIPKLIFSIMPQWLTHMGNNRVLEDDVIFLHLQEPTAVSLGMGTRPMGQVYRMPGPSDAYVAAFRRWLDRVGGGGPWGPMGREWLEAAGARLSREQLLDRYHSHTATCKACSRALGRIQTAVRAVLALAVASLVSFSVLMAAAVVQQGAAVQAVGSQQCVGGVVLAAARSRGAVPAWGALALALVLLVVRNVMQRMRVLLLEGEYPPPRNKS